MISPEEIAEIRRLFFAEHWKIGTIAAQLKLHPETVRKAVNAESFGRGKLPRAALTDAHLDFLRITLAQYPRLRATRLYEMVKERGYTGSVVQLRRVVAKLRPNTREAFFRLSTLPGEHYGKCLVMLRGGGDLTFEGIFSAVVDFLCYITGFK